MLNLVANGSSGYTISNSLRLRSSASAYLNRTFGSGGSQTTWTLSFWVKRGAFARGRLFEANGGTADTNYLYIEFINDQLDIAGYNTDWLKTTQVFRDPSSWYHIVIVADTTQATAANRLKLYVNGSQVTAFATANYPAQNSNIGFNGNYAHYMGESGLASTYYFDGYLTEINFVNAQALTPSSFGSTNATTGVWQPAKYTGTYGTNGFYLNFSNIALTSGSNTGLGKDYSGNGNYWNTNNISVTAGTTYDAMTDVPTLTSATVANYGVLSPLNYRTFTGSTLPVITNGNLNVTTTSTTASCIGTSTLGVTSGKWYFEVTFSGTGSFNAFIGVVNGVLSNTTANDLGYYANEYSYKSGNGYTYNNNVSTAYGASYTGGDVIGVALDLNAGTLTFYKNNVSQGTAFSSLPLGDYYFAGYDVYHSNSLSYNFGQQPFVYSPPSGYLGWNTYNLPTPTILQGNKYMDATLYTANASTQTITNAAGFKPDFVWAKSRTYAYSHMIFDSIRGVNQVLASNNTAVDTLVSGTLTSFNSNGFTVGANENGNYTSGGLAVGWQWQAGQGSTSSNTNGSITSTVSVNATAGFSVVTYTGTGANATVGHGLGVAPKMVITKNRGATSDWAVWHTSLTSGAYYLLLDTTAAQASGATYWNSTIPTSSVFSVGTATPTNVSTNTYVAYCWAEIAGFSKFGSYVGNGSTDGPFVYTGFRPKYLMIKRYSSSAGNAWIVWDSVRETYNVENAILVPNSSNAENTGLLYVDFLSNGFKLRSYTNGSENASGESYIYACWAENPFKNALAR